MPRALAWRRARVFSARLTVLRSWLTRSVLGIVLATFFSDVGHEMVTAVLPMYVASVGLGAAALGVMEGAADLLFSLSKLAGGYVGHRAARKRPWAAMGYLATTLGTASMAFARSAATLIVLRAGAWFGRGFRSPLRDAILADAVEPTHFGRAYGIERTADMLGAVAGPLIAVVLVALGVEFRTVILVSIAPSAASVAFIWFMTKEPAVSGGPAAGGPGGAAKPAARVRLPRAFWIFLVGVFLFGLGDFSRTFLILLAARASHADGAIAGSLTTAVLLYTLHNAVSAAAAYPAGRLGDRGSKVRVLVVGYGLGALTNGLLAAVSGSLLGLTAAIALSGVYIAIEETIEKAVAAELLPRELRSLGFGILACANAFGDMASSLFVGFSLDAGRPTLAFAVPAAFGAAGAAWMFAVYRRSRALTPATAR